jgi:hypothetical protein
MFNSDAKEIVTAIMKRALGDSVGGWYESRYEYQDEKYFDSTSFNREVTRQFENIIEKINEKSEEVYTIQDFIDFKNRITSKFNVEKWYENPKDKNLIFRINSFNPGNMSVEVMVKTVDTGLFKKLELDEEQFNNFLYQNSLFSLDNMY